MWMCLSIWLKIIVSSELDRPRMGLIAAVALISIILASMLCGLDLRQLTRMKKWCWSSEEDVPLGYEYDVFLSFMGPDARCNFTNYLYHRLRLAGLRVFLNSKINGDILKALDKSRIYIPIFSKNYATNSRCLQEVARMVECTSNSDGMKEILPIFFNVDRDDVKLKTKLYKKAIRKHKEKFGSKELKRWEAALVKVACMKGWEIKGKRHGEQIELVVKEVSRKLNAKYVDVPKFLVEDDPQIEAVIEKLDVDSDGVRFVGINGISGIGKTTIVKVVFNRLSSHFDGVCFLDDVRASSQLHNASASSQYALINLQKKLLSSFVGPEITDQIKGIGGGMDSIKRECCNKKVLIVLDDLNKKEQREKLAGKSDWFGSGSRIIITTRDKSILNQTEEILQYEVRDMKFDRALQLFCKCAFRNDSPIEGYDALSEEIVRKVASLPLAIELIGSYLYDVGSDLETDDEKRKLWEETLNQLDKKPDGEKRKPWEETLKQLDEEPVEVVRNVIMISYKGLEDMQKEVFLDIACFFTKKDQTYPITMWDVYDYYPHSAICVLRQRSLIKIRDNKFWMHDQVRNLGRYIVLEEYPCKFSRMWTHEDVVELLGRKERNEDVEALSLTSDGYSRNIALEELAALPNLRFLQVRDIDIFRNSENLLLKLRRLFLQMWRTILCANNFRFSNLVMLDLSNSTIEDGWHGWRQMKMATELKVLNLASCHFLRRTPDLSALKSLEILILEDCKNLEEIHPSIKDIKTLVSLNVSRCRRLKELSTGVGRMKELRELLLDHTAIQEIPISRGGLMKLETLSAQGCSQLAQLPNSMGTLVSLTKLDLSFTGIKELPEFFGSLKKLETLDASNSALLAHIPNSIGHLASLSLLNLSCCPKLAQLPNSIGSLVSLQRLLLRGCLSLTEIPDSIGNLILLIELDLKSTMITKLPESSENLQNLRLLDIRDTCITILPDAIEMLVILHLCEKKSHPETMPRTMSAPSILLPRESMEKMKDEARQRAADMETSDRNYAIAAVQNVVGIDDRVKQITDLLEMEVNDEVRIVGIYGTDGIGKTTLAKTVYDRISSCFDSCSFLAEVEETTQNPRGIQFLQTKLKRDILGRDREDPSFDERIEFFLDVFREMKVLIVVDDVQKQSHLHAIVGDQLHWFGLGSRIIVTSQNEEILKEYDPGKARAYRVSQLDNGQAVALFRKHAFRMQSSRPDYDALANLIVSATVKLPLAVEVIGSFLRGKPIEEWQKMEKSMKLFTMSSQKTTVGFEEIWYICYRGLDQQQKDIVLDIACFVSGVDARIASYMWPNSYRPTSNCILVPLAKIGENNELQMHRLLRCFGKRILNQARFGDRIPRKFYTQDMVPKAIISREKEMENVEALSFNFTAGDFQSMPDIRFLQLDNAKVSGNFEGSFASLRWLCWQRCPLEFDAFNFVVKELVILDLSWSKVTERWEGWSKIKMEKLKVLNLTGCSELRTTPNFSDYKDLEILILERCSHLVKLDPSIGNLERLVSLNLKFCSQLNGLPVELGCMTALTELLIDRTSVREIPICIGNLKQLKILSGFKCFPLTHLPSSICYLTALSGLSLDGAEISELPSSLGDLLKLRRLSLRDCRYLEKLPYSIGKMGSLLEELDISATSISKLPDSIRNLQNLRVLRMDYTFIGAFPVEIGNLTKLEELHASWCQSLTGAIPRDIKRLHHLRSLILGHSSISSLPSEISTISSLQTLDLLQCNEIEVLPKLPPSLICLRVSSKRMKSIPLLKDLKELEELYLSDEDPKECQFPSRQLMPESKVKQLSIWFSRLWNLELLQTQWIEKRSFSILFPKLRKLELSLSQIMNLHFVYEPTDIPQLKTLTLSGLSLAEVSGLPKTLSVLSIQGCSSLKRLPTVQCLTNMSVFELYHSAIEEIEGLEGLKALKRLDISNCRIQNLNGIGQLTSLRSLVVSNCDCLDRLPDLSNLKLLKVLEIRQCKKICQIEGLEELTSLEKLKISQCPAENSVQVQNVLKLVMARSVA